MAKRFEISPNTEVRERLRRVHAFLRDMAKQYPEMAFTMFGSQVKGYAKEESDYDIDIFINADNPLLLSISSLRKGELFSTSKIQAAYRNLFREKAHKILGMNFEFQINSVNVLNLLNKKLLVAPGTHFHLWTALFSLNVAGDVRRYRRSVIEMLEKQGTRGKDEWSKFINYLEDFERGRKSHAPQRSGSRYPRTLAEARKIYLKRTKE